MPATCEAEVGAVDRARAADGFESCSTSVCDLATMVDTVCGGLLRLAIAFRIILALKASKPKTAPNTRPTATNMMIIRLSISATTFSQSGGV